MANVNPNSQNPGDAIGGWLNDVLDKTNSLAAGSQTPAADAAAIRADVQNVLMAIGYLAAQKDTTIAALQQSNTELQNRLAGAPANGGANGAAKKNGKPTVTQQQATAVALGALAVGVIGGGFIGHYYGKKGAAEAQKRQLAEAAEKEKARALEEAAATP